MSLRVGINGVCGRMGRRIAALAATDPDIEIAAALEMHGHAAVGKTLSELGIADSDCIVSEGHGDISQCQALIDFTAPAASIPAAAAAAASGCALVVGTTGFTQDEQAEFDGHAASVACVHAPNMSIGVNLLFDLLGDVARRLGADYDIEVVEMHHRQKADSPSGTAARMVEILADARGLDRAETVVNGRSGMPGARPTDEIGVHAVRGGSVVGDHTIVFAGQGERIELVHRAESRDTFAAGAIRASKFVADRSPGFYTMQDVLGGQ
jgi:4-hydroxy-tetrahydrodipicolinate reductase